MRSLTYVGPGQVEWHEVADAQIVSDADAIVRPLVVARCDLDHAIVTGRAGLPGPFALGHEVVGVVTDIGPAVRSFRPGERVIVPFQISCGTCEMCRSGMTGNCRAVPFRSSYGLAPLSGHEHGGGLADLMRVPFADHMLLHCPAGVDAEAAAGAADNLSDAYRSIAPYLSERPGARILIVGGSSQGIAMYAIDIAIALGAGQVVYVDDDPVRLRLARDLGAEVHELPPEGGTLPGMPFPIVIDASSTPLGLALSVASCAHGAILHRTYGDFQPTTPVPLQQMYGTGVTLNVGRLHARDVMPLVVADLKCGHIHPARVTTRRVPFGEAAEAILEPSIKMVFIAD